MDARLRISLLPALKGVLSIDMGTACIHGYTPTRRWDDCVLILWRSYTDWMCALCLDAPLCEVSQMHVRRLVCVRCIVRRSGGVGGGCTGNELDVEKARRMCSQDKPGSLGLPRRLAGPPQHLLNCTAAHIPCTCRSTIAVLFLRLALEPPQGACMPLT